MKPLTHCRLDDFLLARLREPDTVVQVRSLDPADCAARARWEPEGATDDKLRIYIDNAQVGLVPGAIHELIHAVLDPLLVNFRGSMAEPAIVAWELAHVEWLRGRPKRWAKWIDAIDEKRDEQV